MPLCKELIVHLVDNANLNPIMAIYIMLIQFFRFTKLKMKEKISEKKGRKRINYNCITGLGSKSFSNQKLYILNIYIKK